MGPDQLITILLIPPIYPFTKFTPFGVDEDSVEELTIINIMSETVLTVMIAVFR